MCGIFGQWNIHGKPINISVFNKQRDTLLHRGPDAAQSWFSKKGNTGLAQTRLSIIDLDNRANQPLSNESKTVHAVVNGEIYNFKQLRKELENKGHCFYTNSDSEVIIHGWEEWGKELPGRLTGMFAFIIFDEVNQILFAARDHFGIKPLYYKFENGVLSLASELKAIVTHPDFIKKADAQSISDYFVYRYIPSPNTIWKNVSKLPPAHYLLVDNLGKSIIVEYWKLTTKNIQMPFAEAVAQTKELLLKSVQKHLLSDVPVGTFLSGGYDSTSLVLLQHQLNYPQQTFSIGFNDWNNSEHRFAKMIAQQFNTKHHEEIIDFDSLELLDTLAWNYDEPNGDISTIPTYTVSKLASQHVKVVLSGEGADEIFGGYSWHHLLKERNNIFKKDNLYQYLIGNSMTGIKGYANAMSMGLFDRSTLKKILTSEYHSHIPDDPHWFYSDHFRSDLSPLKAFQYLDIKTFMAELVLQKVDRASMANSLEVRVPFLDLALVEFLFNLNEKVYFKKGTQKAILKAILEPIIPKEIIERKKQGFTGPDLFYQNIEWYKKTLQASHLVNLGFVQKNAINNLLNEKDYWRLWKIVVLEKWAKTWLV